MGFQPKFSISGKTAQALMKIEAARVAVDGMPVSPMLMASLRESARLRSTHFSTRIEGNRLTLPEVQEVLARGGGFAGRTRDEREVVNYYQAADLVDEIARSRRLFRVEDIQKIHGLAFDGKRRANAFRDGQNVIRDGASGGIVYMPPEAKDVPGLMEELVDWVNSSLGDGEFPLPVVAALAHYQFATIHPYYDGNGRTARLLATMVLHRSGYGLKGIYSLEEYYAENLESYYEALAIGESHNYYLGRAEADVTEFVDYFCSGMAEAFAKVKHQTEALSVVNPVAGNLELRELNPLQRQVMGLFARTRIVTTAEVAEYLGVSPRKARDLCRRWVGEKFLLVEDPSNRARKYRLYSEG